MKQIIEAEVEENFRENCDWQAERQIIEVSCEEVRGLIVKAWRASSLEESEDDSLAWHVASCPNCLHTLIHTYPKRLSVEVLDPVAACI